MASTRFEPNETVALGGATVTGAANAHTALSDDSDSSFVEIEGAATRIGYPEPSLPAGAVPVSMRVELRSAKGFTNHPTLIALAVREGVGSGAGAFQIWWTTATTFTWSVVDVDAFDLSDLELDLLLFSADPAIVYEADLILSYVPLPVVVVDNLGTLTEGNLPTISWDDTLDPLGGGQTRYELKIFDEDTYGAGFTGLDPDEDEPYTESGEVASAATSHELDQFQDVLANDTYRAYVRVAQTVDGELLWSDWAFDGFVVDVPTPPVPTVVTTPQPADGRIKLDFSIPNPIANPSFEVDTVGYQNSGAGVTIARVTSEHAHGVAALRVVTPGTATQEGVAMSGSFVTTPSVTNGAVVFVDAPVGAELKVEFQERTAADALVGTTDENLVGIGRWTQIAVERLFGATGVRGRISVRTRTSAQALTFHVDAYGVTMGPSLIAHAYQVQRSVDGGETWEFVRTAFDLSFVSIGEGLAYDAEAPNGVEVLYRARTLHVGANSSVAYSDWSAEVPGEWSSDDWWLKHATQPELSMVVRIRSQPSRNQEARQGVFRPLGRRDPVVVSDERSLSAGVVAFRLDSDAERGVLDQLLETNGPLLLQAPEGVPSWPETWISPGNLSRERATDSDILPVTFDGIEWVEVVRPPQSVLIEGGTAEGFWPPA